MGNQTEITTLGIGLALGQLLLFVITPFVVPTWGEIDAETKWAIRVSVAFLFAWFVPGDALARTIARLRGRASEPPASPPPAEPKA